MRKFSLEKFAVKNSVRRCVDEIFGVPSAIIRTRFNPPAQVVQPPGSWAAYLHLSRLGLAVSTGRIVIRGGSGISWLVQLITRKFINTRVAFGLRIDTRRFAFEIADAATLRSLIAAASANKVGCLHFGARASDEAVH